MTNVAPKVGDYCRWGYIDHVTVLAPGIVMVSTPSHGGIWVDEEHELRIPAYLRAVAREYAPAQWYEEDCDVAIVGVTFADELIAANPLESAFVEACRRGLASDRRYRTPSMPGEMQELR